MMRTYLFKTGILLWFILSGMHTGAQTWTFKGPVKGNYGFNLPGRVDFIVPDPLYDNVTNFTLYAGSFRGGLWQSTDDGNNWTRFAALPNPLAKYDGVADLIVGSTSNPAFIVADRNEGVTKPNSSGTSLYFYNSATSTWSASTPITSTPSSTFAINKIYLHPSNASIIFACTTDGLFRSANGGVTWSLVSTGECRTLAFIPSSNSTGLYPYVIMETGHLNVKLSTDDGNTFNSNAVINSALSNILLFTAVCDYIKDPNTNDDLVYIYMSGFDQQNAYQCTCNSQVNTANDYYILWKYDYTQNTFTESMRFGKGFSCSGCYGLYYPASHPDHYYSQYDISSDRLAVKALTSKNILCSGVACTEYNENVDALYSVAVALSYGHSDIHAFAKIPNMDKAFIGTDGGLAVDNYIVSGGNIVHQTYWRNTGLNICAVNGYGQAEYDPDLYLTGEQDFVAGGTLFRPSGILHNVGSIEHEGGWIDKFDVNSQNMFSNVSSYNPTYIISHNQFSTSTNALNIYANSGWGYSLCEGTNITSTNDPADFFKNTFFQDPYRPDRIYFGTNELAQYCSGIDKFKSKFRPVLFFDLHDPTNPNNLGYYCIVYSMAFSKQNKDKVYLTTNNRNYPNDNENAPGQVFKFAGADFDNIVAGSATEGTYWSEITPNWGTGSTLVSTPILYPDLLNIWYPEVVCSEVNEDRIFVACHDIPNNPQIKVLKYDNAIWTDYSTGIPQDEIPVCMVYEEGTNDGIYLGTNRGVYYRNATMSSWIDYTGDLPRVAVSQMHINYQENTLSVGTYGMGIWKTSLYCNYPGTINLSALNFSSNAFYEAGTNVTCFNSTVTGGDVRFRGGAYVDLLPQSSPQYFDATASAGCTFFAYIHNCAGPGNTFRGNGFNVEEPENTVPQEDVHHIRVFPNPNNGTFIIKSNKLIADPTVEIFDILGKSIFKKQFESFTSEQVDIPGATPGIYYVRITNANGVNETQKLIKQ